MNGTFNQWISACRASAVWIAGWASLAAAAGTAQEFRSWQDNTGNFRVEARLRSVGESSVVLELPDQRTVTVPRRRLSRADLAWLDTLFPRNLAGSASDSVGEGLPGSGAVRSSAASAENRDSGLVPGIPPEVPALEIRPMSDPESESNFTRPVLPEMPLAGLPVGPGEEDHRPRNPIASRGSGALSRRQPATETEIAPNTPMAIAGNPAGSGFDRSKALSAPSHDPATIGHLQLKAPRVPVTAEKSGPMLGSPGEPMPGVPKSDPASALKEPPDPAGNPDSSVIAAPAAPVAGGGSQRMDGIASGPAQKRPAMPVSLQAALQSLLIKIRNEDDPERLRALFRQLDMLSVTPGDQATLLSLEKHLHSRDKYVREKAFAKIVQLSEEVRSEALATALADESQSIRWSAYDYLQKHPRESLLPQLADQLVRFDRSKILSVMTVFGARAQPHLLPLLKDRRSDVRMDVCRTLGEIGTEEAVPALVEMATAPGVLTVESLQAQASLQKIQSRNRH